MSYKKPPTSIVQTSITMDRELKKRYSKMAFDLDLNFSQLVRYALLKVEEETNKKTGEAVTPPVKQ